MTKDQFITIATTAVITVTFREVLGGIVSVVKSLPAVEKAKKQAGWVLSKENRSFLWEAVVGLIQVGFLIGRLRDPNPVSRWDVFMIVVLTLSITAVLVMLAVDTAIMRRRTRLASLMRERPNPD